jgi:hypothetical protein
MLLTDMICIRWVDLVRSTSGYFTGVWQVRAQYRAYQAPIYLTTLRSNHPACESTYHPRDETAAGPVAVAHASVGSGVKTH